MYSKIRSALFLFSCLGALAASAEEPALQVPTQTSETGTAASEAKYFKIRDELCKQFENGASDYETLAVLEKPIKSIIGSVKVDGFRMEGSITLYPSYEENPCYHVDGLDFRNSSQEELFVTTNGLLENYLSRNPKLPKDLDKLFRTNKFYLSTISTDAALTNYADIPVKRAKGQDLIYAFLGGFSQDIGPLIPDRLIVFGSANNRIFVMSVPSKTKVTSIKECKNTWDNFSGKSEKALERYRASNLNDEKLFDEHARLEDEGYVAYYKCYRQKSKDQAFFTSLIKQAQAIVDRLQ